MTATRTKPVIEGPVTRSRFGSVGFRLDDPQAPAMCREALGDLLSHFGLTRIRGGFGERLSEDLPLILTELVTNAQRYGGDAYPAGSFTLFHPGRWLHLTVHDKNPYQPVHETYRAWRADVDWERESGRGLRIVQTLAEAHLGRLEWHSDGDTANPGKVAHVALLLPHLAWTHTYVCPWTGRETAP